VAPKIKRYGRGCNPPLNPIFDGCFGNGTKWISRNQYSALVSGNPFHSIPETTVQFQIRCTQFWGEKLLDFWAPFISL